jgi:hypothetical protein
MATMAKVIVPYAAQRPGRFVGGPGGARCSDDELSSVRPVGASVSHALERVSSSWHTVD